MASISLAGTSSRAMGLTLSFCVGCIIDPVLEAFSRHHRLKGLVESGISPVSRTSFPVLDVVQASQPMLSCGITNGSTCADQTQMVSEPWAPGLCVLVFWCRDAGPSLAENVTCSEMDYTLDEENAAAAYYDNEEDYRTFHYLGNQMKVKRQQAEAA